MISWSCVELNLNKKLYLYKITKRYITALSIESRIYWLRVGNVIVHVWQWILTFQWPSPMTITFTFDLSKCITTTTRLTYLSTLISIQKIATSCIDIFVQHEFVHRLKLHVAEVSCRVGIPARHADSACWDCSRRGCRLWLLAAAWRHHADILNSLPTQHAESASKICSSSGSKQPFDRGKNQHTESACRVVRPTRQETSATCKLALTRNTLAYMRRRVTQSKTQVKLMF